VGTTDLKTQARLVVEALSDASVAIADFGATDKARERLRRSQEQWCNAFSNLELTIRGQIAEGLTVVTQAHASGIHTGVIDTKGMDFSPTGRETGAHAVISVVFDEQGKVTELLHLYDMRAMLLRLGVHFVMPAHGDTPEEEIGAVDGELVKIQ
jgi:hypothetical protein